jgi:hypothetical protein
MDDRSADLSVATPSPDVKPPTMLVSSPPKLHPSTFIFKTSQLPPKRFARSEWPHHVVHLATNFNPDGIAFPYVANSGSCGYVGRCSHATCPNAAQLCFCTKKSCPYGGDCGNGLAISKDLLLVKDRQTNGFALIATNTIPESVSPGQYLDRLTLAPPSKVRVQNRSYRLVMRAAPRHCG